MADVKEKKKSIPEMIRDLNYACWREKTPITIYCIRQDETENSNEPEIIKSVVSPAAFGYDTKMPGVKTFYDLQNVMSEKFTTVPNRRKEEEDDYFEM